MQPDVGKSGLDDRVDLLPVAVGFGHSHTLRNHPAPLKQSSSDKTLLRARRKLCRGAIRARKRDAVQIGKWASTLALRIDISLIADIANFFDLEEM